MRVVVYILSLVFSMSVYSSTIENFRGYVYEIPSSYIRGESGGAWGDKSPLLSLKFNSSVINLNSYYGTVRALVFYDKDYERIGDNSCPMIHRIVNDYERKESEGITYFYEKSGGFERLYYSPYFVDKNIDCNSLKYYLAIYRPARDFVAGSIVSKGVDGCELLFNHNSMAVSLNYNGSECRYEKYSDVVEEFRSLFESWRIKE